MTKTVSSSAAGNASTAVPAGVGDGLIEAAWLAAAIVVPLVFTQQAFVNFEPAKAAVERLLAAIIAAAWVIKTFLNKGFKGINGWPPRAVMIALAGVLGAQVLATIFSVDPRVSLWGIRETSQGLFTAMAEAVLFLAVASQLRRPAQLDRLVTAVVVTSVPVALYALIQRAGFDPVPYTRITERVFSTLGHPIYLAAYLTMVMPLTWWKIAREARLGASGESSWRRLARLLFPSGIALVQIAGFIATQSRGPLLAFFASAAFFGLGGAVHTRQWRWLLRGGAVLGVAVAFLVFLNLPLSSSARVARVLGLQRFANLGLSRGPDPFRKAHWEAGVRLMTSPQAITYPNGGSDPWHALRFWIGYGPETLDFVLPQYYIWPGTDFVTENRLHDRVLDLWFATGILGVLTYYGFTLLVFQQGLSQIGFGSPRLTFLVVPGLAMAGGVLFWLWSGRGFLGLGMIVGFVAGCGARMLAAARRPLDQGARSGPSTDKALLTIALLAALAGHLLETGFAFTVLPTSLLFWLYAGLLLAVPFIDQPAPQVVPEKQRGKVRQRRASNPAAEGQAGWREAYLAAYGPALILIALLFAFVHLYALEKVNWTGVLIGTMTRIKVDQGPSHFVWFLLIPTWLAANFAFARNAPGNPPVRLGMALTISALLAVAYAVCRSMQIANLSPVPGPNDPPANAISQIAGYEALYFGFLGLLLVLLLGAGFLLDTSAANTGKATMRLAGWNLLATGLGGIAAWFLALSDIRADITATWGSALVTLGRTAAGIKVFRQSLLEKPESIPYRRQLAAALIQRAQDSPNFESFDWQMHEAEASLLPATLEVHGLNPAGGDLARLYMLWAGFAPDSAQQLALAQSAAASFEQQQRYAPGHTFSWLDSAVLDEFRHQPAEAERNLRIALGVMNGRTSDWANYYSERTIKCTAREMRAAHAAITLRLFEMAILETKRPADAAALRLQRAVLNVALGRVEEARQDCLAAQPAIPASGLWLLEGTLAEVERLTGHFAEAKAHLERAVRVAPPERQALLLEQQRHLQGP